MKSILILLPVLAAIFPCNAADEDWRKAALEFMREQRFAPIEVKDGTSCELEKSREQHEWMKRVMLPPFEKHLEQWPERADEARRFVTQALLAKTGHPEVDPERPWSVMAKEGEALVKAKVDDPLVLWLAAWTIWVSHEGYTESWDFLNRAKGHKLLKDYPSMLATFIHTQINECRRSNSREPIEKTNLERYKHALKSAVDPAIYRPEDDELLFNDIEFVFTNTNVSKRADELRKLCETPHFTPWLREMMLGSLENRIAWTWRGGGFSDTVKEEGWKKFGEHQVKAAPHFVKAWELRPDRPHAAVRMIDLVKCGNGPPGDTLRLWFDRATAAQIDDTHAYYELLWALRPRWGGSIDQMKAFYFATVLTDRQDAGIAVSLRRILDYIEDDVEDFRFVLSQEPMKSAVVASSRALAESDHVYRRWQHDWRLADLALMAWAAGDYETAHETFLQVPVPLPRQTRRRIHLKANETDLRGQSAVFAFGLNAEWEAAEEAYALRKVDEALQAYQDVAARFQGEPPAMLLQRIAACKFEKVFATGKWMPIRAFPDLADWYHRSGTWKGLNTGTLVNVGQDAQAYLLHNGRVGSNFEMTGLYEIKNAPAGVGGLNVMIGYHRSEGSEEWTGCAHWSRSITGSVASMLRGAYTTKAPQITPPVNGRIWRFHVLCRDGVVTYRLNHRDIAVNYPTRRDPDDDDSVGMRDDSLIGFCHHFLKKGTETHVRQLSIRKLDPQEPPEEIGEPGSLEDLRSGFAADCARRIKELNAAVLVEAGLLVGELKRAQKKAQADKTTAFETLLKQSTAVKIADMPVADEDEIALATLLRGYHASHESRIAATRTEWKQKALKLTEGSEAEAVRAFITSELEPRLGAGMEEPLRPENAVKWQQQMGEWKRNPEVLSGRGDSLMTYDFHRAAPFQIDFEITVLEGMRPRLVMGNVKFANEAYKTTFGLYPQSKGASLFTYERKKPYQITIKAAKEKTELLVDGVKVCDGPKIEGVLDMLQFRGGDDYSKGKAEFRKIRISPLP